MGCIKLLFLGLMSLEPLPVSFPQASPPCCSYFSLLSATASHSFARAVWHVGLQQWSPSHPCSCLTNFQIPYRDCMSRRLENRSIFFFLSAAAATSLEQTAWAQLIFRTRESNQLVLVLCIYLWSLLLGRVWTTSPLEVLITFKLVPFITFYLSGQYIYIISSHC